MNLIDDKLDTKLFEDFKGYVVRKDIVRQIKVGANVPVFVLEYLIANSCSSNNEEQIQKGIENVKKILQDHYVNPEESNLIHSRIKENGSYKIIDKISVSLDSSKDIYWASLFNSNIKNANINSSLITDHEKLLLGGIWAVIDISYDPEIVINNKIYPFVVTDIKPIQLSSFDFDRIKDNRKNYSKSEWIDVLLRSMGYEPNSPGFSYRLKMLLLSRLIPLVESNFNLIELGPRMTGKSYVFKEITPYAIVLSGGQASVAQMFVNNSNNKIGLVGLWDTVTFDEAAGIKFKDKHGIQIMKDYMESGSFSRGGSAGELTGSASIVFNGNINQPLETLLKTSHLFSPLAEEIRNDTAFLDRIHFYLPGWEVIKLSTNNFTDHFGFSTDFFSESMKYQRRSTFTDAYDKYFTLGSHLKQRDSKAVKKTVSGLIKLIHPDGIFSKEDVCEYLEIALEMRRRVKEQLKRIGGMEFWDTNFSYIDKNNQEEKYIPLPEERGSSLIENSPLPPGTCYVATNLDESFSLLRIEVIITTGNGKLNIYGSSNTVLKDSIKNVHQYLKANEKTFFSELHRLANYDISVQISSLSGSSMNSGLGSAVFVCIISAMFKKNLKNGLAILGDISLGGAIERVSSFADKVSLLAENGAKNIIVPIDNLLELQNIPRVVLDQSDVNFYSNTQMLLQKAFLNN